MCSVPFLLKKNKLNKNHRRRRKLIIAAHNIQENETSQKEVRVRSKSHPLATSTLFSRPPPVIAVSFILLSHVNNRPDWETKERPAVSCDTPTGSLQRVHKHHHSVPRGRHSLPPLQMLPAIATNAPALHAAANSRTRVVHQFTNRLVYLRCYY